MREESKGWSAPARLFHLLAASAMCAGILVLGPIVYFLHLSVEGIALQEAQAHMSSAVRANALYIRVFLSSIENELDRMAVQPALVEHARKEGDSAAISGEFGSLNEILRSWGGKVSALYLLDTEGKVFCRFPDFPGVRGKDYSAKPEVRRVLETRRPCMRMVQTGEGFAALALCRPVSRGSEFSGIARALVDLADLREVAHYIKIDRRGYELVFHAKSQISLALSPGEDLWRNETPELRAHLMEKTLGAQDFCELYEVSGSEEKKIIAHSAIEIEGERWSVFAVMDYREITGPIHQQTLQICLIFGLILLLLGSGTVFAGKIHAERVRLLANADHAARMRELNEFYENVLAAMPAGLMVLEADLTVTSVNAFYRSMFGLRDEAGFVCPWTFREGRLGQDRLPESPLAEIARQGVAPPAQLKPDKDRVLSVSVSRFELQARPKLLLVLQDISQRVLAEERVRRIELELLQANRLASLGEMAAGINHEVNQPLTAIMNYAENALDFLSIQGIDAGMARDNLRRIREQVQRAKSIVQHIRAFAHGEKVVYAELDLNVLVQKTCQFFSLQFQLQGIDLELDLDERLPSVRGNKLELQQVFNNLIGNAMDALADSPRKRLRIATCVGPGNEAQAEVLDTGAGFDLDVADKIFDPFFTTKAARQGTGLGLSITYRIVKEHGGSIHAEGLPGKGARFTIALPPAENREEKR